MLRVMIRNSLFQLVITCGLVSVGCTTDGSTTAEPDPAPSDGDPATAEPDTVTTNTDQQAVSLPAPTIVHGGSSTVETLDSVGGTGLGINGGSELGAFVIASYRIRMGNTTTAEFTVTPATGAAFVYALIGWGGGYSGKQLRFERKPGSNELQVTDAAGTVACGAIPSESPTAVTVVYTGGAPSQFDVLINGAPTACTDRPTTLRPPVTGFNLMDAANVGYGGRVQFSDLALF